MENMAQHFDNISHGIHDCQKTFKTLMMALAYPGTIRNLSPLQLSTIAPQYEYTLQPLVALLDLETTHYIFSEDSELKHLVNEHIKASTGSRSVALEDADFVLCLESSAKTIFKGLKRGTLHNPDKGATLIYHVDDLKTVQEESQEQTITLKGPGIKTSISLVVDGLTLEEPALWQSSRLDYPLGIDIFLISAAGGIVGIPRSVNVILSGVN